MKRLLIVIDSFFFLSSCTAVYFYFFFSPIQNDKLNLPVIYIFLTALFIAIATGTTLVLYSPHLILRRKFHAGRTKDFLWKPVLAASLRRGVLLALSITGFLALKLFGQGSLVNIVCLIAIFALIEIYFSRIF